MNAASWIILGILVVIVVIALIFIFRNKGKCCSCSEEECPYCKKRNKEKNTK